MMNFVSKTRTCGLKTTIFALRMMNFAGLTELLFKRYEMALGDVSHTNGLRVLYELTRQAPTSKNWNEPRILDRILGHGHPQPWMSGGAGPPLARHDVLWRKEAEDRAIQGAALFKDHVMKRNMERQRMRKKLIKDTIAELDRCMLEAEKECNFEMIASIKSVIDQAGKINDKELMALMTDAERALIRLEAECKLSQVMTNATAAANRPIRTRDAIMQILELEKDCKARGNKMSAVGIITQAEKLRPVLEAEVKLGKALDNAMQIKAPARDRPKDLELIEGLQRTLKTAAARKLCWAGDICA